MYRITVPHNVYRITVPHNVIMIQIYRYNGALFIDEILPNNSVKQLVLARGCAPLWLNVMYAIK